MVVQHFWCRKIREIMSDLSPSSDVMSLTDKCIVVGCFFCGNYDKILIETGKFSYNITVTEKRLVSGVDGVH